MKALYIKPKYRVLLHAILLFLVVAILNFLTLNSVEAQEGLEPQLVTAENFDGRCVMTDIPTRTYIEFYNVGSEGGEAYSKAIYFIPQTYQEWLSDTCTLTGYQEVDGTFTGGPNGTFTFDHSVMTGRGDNLPVSCQVMEGKTIECNYNDEWNNIWNWVFTIENPEAFQSVITPSITQEPTPGVGCTPNVRGLDPAKPGDVISPGASYVDANGKETGVIQDRWYFNGKESTSIVWDGNPVTVELQYTCLDHTGYSKTFAIAPYQQPPAPAGGEPESQEPKGVTPLGVAAIISAGIGVLGSVGVAVGFLLKGTPPVPSAPPPPPPPPQVTSVDSPPLSFPVQYPPPSPPVQYFPPTQTEPPVPPPPAQPAGLTTAQRIELTNIRGQMVNEVNDLKTKWRANRDAVNKLKELLKKNLQKFTFKKGFDVSEWIVNSPVELITKLTVDPLMEKVFEKHDTSQDSNIILNIHNRIQQLQGEMQEMVNQEKYLQTEISKLNQKLG